MNILCTVEEQICAIFKYILLRNKNMLYFLHDVIPVIYQIKFDIKLQILLFSIINSYLHTISQL